MKAVQGVEALHAHAKSTTRFERRGTTAAMHESSVLRHSVLDVGFDEYNRPLVTLAAADSEALRHEVLLESLRPTVIGFCITCFEAQLQVGACAARKARSCGPMVAYLSQLNRDRKLRSRLFGELERVRQLETLLVS